MNRQRTLNVLPLCIMIALLAAFLFVLPVFAQDEVPPEVIPTEAPVEVLPTEVAEAVPAEVVPTETPADVLQTEVTPVEQSPTEAAPVEEATADEPNLAEALDEVGVVLADASGEIVSLATQASGMLMTAGDPYFTVGSTTYQFFKEGYTGCGSALNITCFVSYDDPLTPENENTPISDALTFMEINNLTPTDRKLYIESDTYNENIWVNGNAPGVKGLLGLVGLGDSPEDVQINGFLYIFNFPTGFSVNNLSVTNSTNTDDAAIWTWNNQGTIKLTDVKAQATAEDSTGIIISHSGTVELDRVNANNNAYEGAYIYNFGTGPIKINNSTFDDNLVNVANGNAIFDCTDWDSSGYCIDWDPIYTGLNIGWSAGPLTISGVSVSGNGGDGLGIRAYNSAVTIKNSVFDNNVPEVGSPADGNWGDGLFIDSNTATLENIQANNNDLRGIVSYANTSFTGKHLHTETNGWHGVQVSACQYNGTKCTISGAGNVVITESSSSGNGGDGINILAKGVVTLTGIYSGYNGEDGIFVDNTYSPTVPAVNLTDIETGFNLYMGAHLMVKGPVTARDLFIYNNSGDGLNIVSTGTGAITITNASNIFNLTRDNGYFGYYIDTMGPVTVTNFDTHDNGSLGGVISNFDANSAAAVTVNMIGTTDFINGYCDNGSGGLLIQSRGVVTVSRVGITDNNGVGLEVNNRPIILTAPGVAVTVSDSYFYRNSDDGLRILSKGLVTLVNINANDNHGFGATIDN